MADDNHTAVRGEPSLVVLRQAGTKYENVRTKYNLSDTESKLPVLRENDKSSFMPVL